MAAKILSRHSSKHTTHTVEVGAFANFSDYYYRSRSIQKRDLLAINYFATNMKKEVIDEELPTEMERYLALVKRAYERMVETDAWPWPDDSNKPELSSNSKELAQ